jgi:REP element-mobilizing transposase RayT
MPDKPLAYFITFSAYGSWLHGREMGSVDREQNEVGTPFLPGNPEREQHERGQMRDPAYLLDSRRRRVKLETILEVCQHRGWKPWAAHVRTTHVHTVATADAPPEKVMADLKAYASRRLKERLNESADAKRWTRHGSTRYLWTEEGLHECVHYVVEGQGEPMDVYQAPGDDQNVRG